MTDLSRREFGGVVAKTAVAGALVWTVPTITSVEPAGAIDRHSQAPKPRNPGRVESSQLPTPTPAIAVETGQLPYTGNNELREAAVGAVALVAGAVVVAKTREPRAL